MARDAGFMENISVNKRKRGGQTKYEAAQYRLPFGNAKTIRGRQNTISYFNAFGMLDQLRKDTKKETFDYLLAPTGKNTILAELGRIQTDNKDGFVLFFSVASAICKQEMPTAKAIGYIRKMRGLGITDQDRAWGLFDAIRRTIKTYCELHQSITPGEIERALEKVFEDYKSGQIKPTVSTPSPTPSPIQPA